MTFVPWELTCGEFLYELAFGKFAVSMTSFLYEFALDELTGGAWKFTWWRVPVRTCLWQVRRVSARVEPGNSPGGEFLYEPAFGKFAVVSVCKVWELAGGEFLYELAFGKFAECQCVWNLGTRLAASSCTNLLSASSRVSA